MMFILRNLDGSRKPLICGAKFNQLSVFTIKCKQLRNHGTSPETETVSRGTRRFDEIPGPRPLPLIGNAWRYLPLIGHYDPQRLHVNAAYNYRKYGPLVREQVFKNSHTILHVFDPKDMATVFRNEGRQPERRSHRALLKYRQERPDHYNSGGLFPENGEEWYRLRRTYQNILLSPRIVQTFIPSCESVSRDLIHYIKARRDPMAKTLDDVTNDLYRWALEITGKTSLGVRLGCFDLSQESGEAEELIKAAHLTHEAIMRTEMFDPFDRWMKEGIKNPEYKKLVESQDFIGSIIRKHMTEQLKKDDSDDDEVSFLKHFRRISDPSVPANFKDIFAMIIDVFLAGIDTTSFTCAYLFHFLAKHPVHQDRIREEIMQIFTSKDQPIEPSTFLSRIPYLKACVKETMRLQPVSIGVGRLTTQDIIIRDYLVPKGTMIITHNQVACRQPEYFDQPDEFVPERWLSKATTSQNEGDEESSGVSPGAKTPYLWLPFGAGPRMCIGRRFAEMETYLLTALILRYFRIDLPEGAPSEIGTLTRLINVPERQIKLRFIDLDV